jgi:hypothetical protein
MGMFDSVHISCPRCGHSMELRSKAGDCTLACYSQYDVPIAIAADLTYNLSDGERHCEKCRGKFKMATTVPARVPLLAVPDQD